MEHITGYNHRVRYIVSFIKIWLFINGFTSYQWIPLFDNEFFKKLNVCKQAKKYPNQAKTYLLPGTTRANRNPQLMKMAQGRCQELELVYGRGMYTVKHEKPVIPEGKLDFEDDMINVTLGQQTEVLKYILRKIKEITLETDEDVRIAKQIINDLTDAIIEFKQSKSNDEMSKTTAGFMQQGGMVAQHSRSLYN